MTEIKFQVLRPNDQKSFQLIAGWYLSEWKIPAENTMQRLENLTADPSQLQVLMTLDNTPIATGGVYNHVGLLDKVPALKRYEKWLALVYTVPVQRKKGYGALLCNHIQEQSRARGIDKMYLFTDTAEQLYKRLGWIDLERIALGDRNIVVMGKDLANDNTE